MLKTEIKKRYKGTPNPFLCKSGFYITELHMDDVPGDGYELTSTTDLAGPFKTLQRARQVFKDKVIDDPYLNDYQYDIRGPADTTGSIWYSGKERPSD